MIGPPPVRLVTGVAWVAFGIAAVVDWVAVWRGDRRAEWVAKPAATTALVVAAVLLDPVHDGRRAWFVVALVLCLAGDVFLMLPDDRFVPGLASFLLGHLAYVAGFWTGPGVDGGGAALGSAAILVVLAVVGSRVARSAGPMAVPVVVYMVVIAVMAVSASGSAEAWAVVGAWLFVASDALLAWNRFVQPVPGARVGIMVSYHLAQAALVVSLT